MGELSQACKSGGRVPETGVEGIVQAHRVGLQSLLSVSVHRSLLGIAAMQKMKAIRPTTEAAERAYRWLRIKRNSHWVHATWIRMMYVLVSCVNAWTVVVVSGRHIIQNPCHWASDMLARLKDERRNPWNVWSPPAGLPGEMFLILKDPKHPMTPGYINDDVLKCIKRFIYFKDLHFSAWNQSIDSLFGIDFNTNQKQDGYLKTRHIQFYQISP